MKYPTICAVVTGSTIKDFLTNLERIQELSDMVELRIDTIKNVKPYDVITIRKNVYKKNIVTCRNNVRILQQAYNLDFDHIDIDLSIADDFEFNRMNKTKVIISYHDFQKTPPLKTLESIKKEMKKYKPVIMKFATMVRSEKDNVTLLQFLLNKKKSEHMIVIGMGEKGKITRIVIPFLGGYCTFASTPYSHSAPGQINIKTLQTIYNQMI